MHDVDKSFCKVLLLINSVYIQYDDWCSVMWSGHERNPSLNYVIAYSALLWLLIVVIPEANRLQITELLYNTVSHGNLFILLMSSGTPIASSMVRVDLVNAEFDINASINWPFDNSV